MHDNWDPSNTLDCYPRSLLDGPEHGASGDPLAEQKLVLKCPKCCALLPQKEWERQAWVCMHCGYHFRLRASKRIALLLDSGSFHELASDLLPEDPPLQDNA